MRIILPLILLLVSFPAYAVTVIGVSGAAVHGSSLTITGSDFGSKSPAAPRIWDACDDSSTSDLDTHYPGDRFPTACAGTPGETPYLMDYRTSFHGFSTMPHGRITKFLSSAATTCDGNFSSAMANNVVTTGDWEVSKLYIIYYYRVGSGFSLEDSELGDNLKELAANGCVDGNCGTYLNGSDNYVDWCNEQTPMITNPSDAKMRSSGASSCIPGVDVPNPMQGWTHVEVEWDTTGWRYTSSNGSTVADGDWNGNSIAAAGGSGTLPKSISIGGFTRWPRVSATGNYRYWAGVYADDTYSRVMIGNYPTWSECTIREPQIPSAWTEGDPTDSITVTVNQGALSFGINYLFVFDSNNTTNATGYAVTISDGTKSINGASVSSGASIQ